MTGNPGPPTAAQEQARAGEVHLAGLLTRMANRDEAALGELYDLTVGRLYSLALRISGNRADAEESVCDTYVQAWQQAGSYQAGRGTAMAWLFTICRSRCLDRLRRIRTELSACGRYASGEAEPPHHAPGPDDLLSLMENSTRVHLALAAIEPVRRQLLSLAYLRGMSQEEIAQSTGLPLGTVKSHIRRGLAQLKRILEERGHE